MLFFQACLVVVLQTWVIGILMLAKTEVKAFRPPLTYNPDINPWK